jgi:SAM-dependent methyltransferase
MGIISGFYTTRTMQALFNIGFFDEIQKNGSVRLESFAAQRNLDVNILVSLCDSLYALRILGKTDGEYRLDDKGEILVEVARGWFNGTYGYEGVFHDLEALLKKEKEYGKDVTRRSEHVARGSGEIENWLYFPLAMEIIRQKGYRKVLDLGCGDGTFLRALCSSNPEIVACGVDIAPEAIEAGQDWNKQAGLDDRIHLFVEDVTKLDRIPDALQGVDAATTIFVLHELLYDGADSAVQLLRSFREEFPGVPLIVFEVVRATPEAMRRRPGMAIHYILQHDLTHQKPLNETEWRDLFKAAGYASVEERYLRFARSAIYTLC